MLTAEQKHQKKQTRKFDFVVTLLLTLIFAAGFVLFLLVVFSSMPDLRPASRWLARGGSLIIGLVCAMLPFVFGLRVRFLLKAKRTFRIVPAPSATERTGEASE